MTHSSPFSRRNFLKASLWGAGGLAGLAALSQVAAGRPEAPTGNSHPQDGHPPDGHNGMHGDTGDGAVGTVDTSRFDPMAYLTAFDLGRVSTLESGQTLREWDVYAVNHEIEVAPGVFYPGWAYGLKDQKPQVPGPTFRCNAGDRLRFHFSNGSDHPHTIHFHGIHPPSMDGITPIVKTGETFTYEFDAQPFGIHPYHCHTMPLKRHIHKGLYGTFIIDPPGGRPPAREYVMTMNAFDTNFDNENDIYAVNTVAFYYAQNPIQVKVGELVRVYLNNMTEFDPINSFHLHAEMFNVYRTGTRLEPQDYTDTIMLCQGERHILEMKFTYPGHYMFHAHQTELAELGWLGMFAVTE